MSQVNRTSGSHLSRLFVFNGKMRPNPRKVLADNLRRIVGDDSQSAWAAAHKIDKKPVQRAISGRHATTIDTLDEISRAAGLQPWQLLTPGLDPANPPVYVMTKAERDLYARVRAEFEQLPPVGNGK